MSYARSWKLSVEDVSAYNTNWNGLLFLKGIGGMRIFFLAGSFMTGVPYATSNSSFMQTIWGISVRQVIGITTGTVLYSWTVNVPLMR